MQTQKSVIKASFPNAKGRTPLLQQELMDWYQTTEDQVVWMDLYYEGFNQAFLDGLTGTHQGPTSKRDRTAGELDELEVDANGLYRPLKRHCKD